MTDIRNNDIEAQETSEWLDALADVLEDEGTERAQFIIKKLTEQARKEGVKLPTDSNTNYLNTIPLAEQPMYPGDFDVERRIRSIIRWNAIMIVMHASKKDLDLGGHMASYQSAASFYEVGFNCLIVE